MTELSSRIAAVVFVAALAIMYPLQILAESEADAANMAAGTFLAMIEGGDAGLFYREQLGRRWKDKTDEIKFTELVRRIRDNVGRTKPSDRRIMYSLPFTRIPDSNEIGIFYSIRYLSTYPIGRAFEDIYVEREADGQWRVVGYFSSPAPN